MNEGRANRRPTVLWTLWMVAGGIAATAAIYLITGSWAWAFLALLAAGVVLNAIAQLVVQPVAAACRHNYRLRVSK
jgi:hypothetical protein